MNGQQGRDADLLLKKFPQAVSRTLGCNHGDIHPLRRGNLFEMDIETMREHQGIPLAQILFNRFLVDLGLDGVGNQHHDHIRFLNSWGDVQRSQSIFLDLLSGLAAGV